MAKVQISQRARDALRRITLDRRQRVGFIASRALYQRLMTRIYRLRDFPELGRLAPEMPDEGVRQLVVPPYRILYEFADDTVTILNIVHGRSLSPDDANDSES
ncbi:MAG: type II toxin-antitoxin system RelE/ParE family toxin [Thermomicrobiales bacterium]